MASMTALFGTVSFELYGQLHEVVADPPPTAKPSSPLASATGPTS
jgi:hypothetical protein